MTALLTGRTCERCGYWAQTLECSRERETGERCEREPLVSLVAAPVWSAPDIASRVCEVFPLPAPRKAPRAARAPRVAPDLIGVAAWWSQVPASLLAKDRHWGETTSTRDAPIHQPFTAEQMARRRVADQVAEYVALGHSAEWARWYCGPLVEGFNGGRKAVSRREEYALFVSSASGPALDKIAKKLSPARKGSRIGR